MVVVVVRERCLVCYPYSCGWVLYILFYLLVLYSVLTLRNIPEVGDTDLHFAAFSIEAV